MTIIFLKYSEIDKKRWDNCIRQSSYPTIFADYDFLTDASPEWCALIAGNYEYVMPLPTRIKLSIKYVFTPFQFSRLGIFSAHPITPTLVKEFIEAIPLQYKQIDLHLNQHNPPLLIEEESIQLISYQLDLSAEYDTLYSSFSENTKRNIKSAEKYNLRITSDITLDEIVNLFQHNRGMSKSIKIKKRDYRLFLRISEYALQHQFLELIGVQDVDGRLLAGAFFLQDYNRRWFWFSGRDNKKSQKKAMFFLISEYLKREQKQPLILDFDGSMNQNIARFYQGFGAVRYSYPMLCFSRRFYLQKLVKLYKAIRDKEPIFPKLTVQHHDFSKK